MREYSFFSAFLFSFFSRASYMDAGTRWKGTGAAYLLLLCVLTAIPPMMRAHLGIAELVDNQLMSLAARVPEIRIEDGVVSVAVEQPYVITEHGEAKPLVVIDTTGTIESLDDTEAIGLLTLNKFMIRKTDVETQVYDLRNVREYVIDRQRVEGWLRFGRSYLALVAYPFAVLGVFLLRLALVLLYSAAGLLFAAWRRVTLSFKSLMRLASLALTPAAIIGMIAMTSGVVIPGWGIISLAMSLGYLFFGVQAVTSLAVDDAQ